MLNKTYKRAIKAGGTQMPKAKYATIFGNDSTLRRNVLRACGNERYGVAILAGTFADHRVIESLNKLGVLASRIVLDVEAKLGRKLTRAKVQQLTNAYLKTHVSAVVRPTADIYHFPVKERREHLAHQLAKCCQAC